MTTSRKRLLSSLTLAASLAMTALAADPATPEFAPNQPHRPADFKPVVYPSPQEMREKYSDETMKRADELMQRVAETNEKGKYKPTYESLDSHKAPEWFLDAKFGMFIDWGLYSVAAYSPSGYPDWYLNRMMYDTKDYHDKTWGADFRQDDFIQLFTGKDLNTEYLTDVARSAGMKYVIPFLKHHDGFCLWNSSFTKRNSVELGPKRDIAREWADSCRKRGLKFGFYYSIEDWAYPVIGPDGNVDIRLWHIGNPDELVKDTAAWDRKFLTGKIPVRDFFEQYINAAAVEFFDKYDPDIFWGDGDWGGSLEKRKFRPVISYFLNNAAGRKEVVFNDRLGECRGAAKGDAYKVGGKVHGVTQGDFLCGECSYEADKSVDVDYPWEQNSGLSHSFGYNWRETDKDVRSAGDLVTMLVDIVSDGGNLLLITNLTPSGKLDPLMAVRLKEVGDWMRVNSEGIYATRKWAQGRQGALRFTRSKDGKTVYVFSTRWPGRSLAVKNLRPVEGSKITMLGVKEPLNWSLKGDELVVDIPGSVDAKRPCDYVWGFKLEAQPVLDTSSHQADTTGSVMPDVLLETLEPVKIERGWSRGGKDWRKFSCTGGPLSINGKTYADGIGLHAVAEAVFEIKPAYERFVAQVGVDDAGKEGSVKVSVYGDDQLLLETGVLKCNQPPVNIDLTIPHAMDGRRPAQLRIVVRNAVEGINDDHTDIVNAGFVASGKK